jgi:hypothetical protein
MTCTADYNRGKGQTRPLIREGATYRQNRNCLTVTKCGLGPQNWLDTKTACPLTVGCNVTLISSWLKVSSVVN